MTSTLKGLKSAISEFTADVPLNKIASLYLDCVNEVRKSGYLHYPKSGFIPDQKTVIREIKDALKCAYKYFALFDEAEIPSIARAWDGGTGRMALHVAYDDTHRHGWRINAYLDMNYP